MEKKLIATRDGLGDELVELGGKNKNIYVVDADIGKSCKTTKFAKTFPEQHVNVGIAEQNAAGLGSRSCYLRKDSICCYLCSIWFSSYV